MPKLSVVVPIYNVEDYLEACLDSIAAQTLSDLEVVMVNDGSTDASPRIAEAYARRDPRFRLVHRPNGGLSAARNTGIPHAKGEYLAFVDSDDELPRNAYELLVGSLERTGSDFATGKVLRKMGEVTKPTRFLRETFRETRLKTHITRFRPLLADRIAWNKAFRRSFWDAQGLTFPEGRINEDIPVMLPLHFSASAVDVIAEPVYFWRFREIGELSITERRVEKRALLHRIQAVSDVHDWLARHGPKEARHWYDEVLVADDLKYYLNVLDRADDEWRELFLEKVNALLDRADDDIYDPLPAIERLKWHLVRRRLMDEVLEVLRFEREELQATPPVRDGRHWVGDYPFRTDERLAIPRSVYRLDQELTVTAKVEGLRYEDGRLRIEGWAAIDGIGAPSEGFQKLGFALLRPGRLRRLRYLVAARRFTTTQVHRPELNGAPGNRVADISWAGFEAEIDPAGLGEGRWELYVTIRAGGVRRIRKLFSFDPLRRVRAVDLPGRDGVRMRAGARDRREIAVEVSSRWAAVTGQDLVDGALELTGELHGDPGEGLKLELREAGGTARRRLAVELADGRFTARLPLEELAGALGAGEEADDEDPDDDLDAHEPAWELYLAGGGRRHRLGLAEEAAQVPAWPAGAREAWLTRTTEGDALLVVRAPRAVLTDARWEDGRLVLETPRDGELVLFAPDRLALHAFPGREATPAAIPSLAGTLPLPEGRWRVCLRDGDGLVAASPDPRLTARLPLETVVRHKPFALGTTADGDAVLHVGRDLDADERSPFQQRALQRTAYAARRSEPLQDAVVYSSFRGRQYSDSPRALHEELVRRGAPLEHLWVVRDGACEVPPTARVLREGSREHHEAMARARYVVFNDHFPDWFSRRDDQLCVQTWHGTPIKRLGFDVSRLRGSRRKFEREWDEQKRNWQYVVSPNRFATPILRSAYELEASELLETGYPRDDLLAGPGREERTRALRERLAIPEGTRVVLYAPTFRDHVRDGRGRYRLDWRLDLDRLHGALGSDTVLLVRKHHYIVDDLPAGPGGLVRDVSAYPDGNELLLAADVLLTDYSSMMVDFANTGRPMVFFAYDLEDYRDEIRGFYVDFEGTVPGPLLTTSDEVVEALRDPDALRSAYAERYAAFTQRFCELDDGGAAGRVVDRVFGA